MTNKMMGAELEDMIWQSFEGPDARVKLAAAAWCVLPFASFHGYR